MKKVNNKQVTLLIIYVVACITTSANARLFLKYPGHNFFGDLGAALIIVCPTLIVVCFSVVTVLLFNAFKDQQFEVIIRRVDLEKSSF